MTNIFDVQFTVDLFTIEDKLLRNVPLGEPHQVFDNRQLHDFWKVPVNFLTTLMGKVDP